MVVCRKTLQVHNQYGTPVDNGQVGTYTDAGDTGAMNSFRYTTPSGLPLGAVVAIQYAPYTGAADNNSSNAAGALDANGNESALEYAVDIVPIEGLKLELLTTSDDSAVAQQEEGGAYYATYSVGAFSLGYGKSYQASSLDTDTTNGADYMTTLKCLLRLT